MILVPKILIAIQEFEITTGERPDFIYLGQAEHTLLDADFSSQVEFGEGGKREIASVPILFVDIPEHFALGFNLLDDSLWPEQPNC